MVIPKRFKILGVVYSVHLIEQDDWKDPTCVGKFEPVEHAIYVMRHTSDDSTQQTYWHECAHAMMTAMGRDKLNADEPFIDLLASMIHQILTTSELECQKPKKKKR